MTGNPKSRAAPAGPALQFTGTPEHPRTERRRAKEQQASRSVESQEAAAHPGAALEHAKAAVLADFLWKRQKPGPGRPVPVNKTSVNGSAAAATQCQRLAEIQELAEALRQKVVRYGALQAALLSARAPEPSSDTAVLWIQEALEDIAATALGIQIASRELFLQATSAGEPARPREPAQQYAADT